MSSAKQARTSDGSGGGQGATATGAGEVAGKNGASEVGKNNAGSRGGSGRPARAGGTGTRGPAAKSGQAGTRGPAAKPGQAAARGPAAKPSQARPGKPAQSQTRKARDRARARELAEQRANAEPAPIGPPLWLQLTTFILSIAGLGVSVYMTIEHFTGNTTLACSSNSVVNCGAVTTSPESMVFGVFPVAVLGLAFFVVMVAITSPWAWRSARREIALVRLGSVIVGVGFIIYLIYVELFQVGFICLECTSVHVITFLLFAFIALSAAVWGLIPRDVRQPRAA